VIDRLKFVFEKFFSRLEKGVDHFLPTSLLYRLAFTLFFIAAFAPLVFFFKQFNILILCLNAFAWLVVAALVQQLKKNQLELYLNTSSGLEAHYQALLDLQNDEIKGGLNLSQSLGKIVELAYRELPVNSVELSLFDEESELWSQSLLMGDPLTYNSQSMMLDSVESSAHIDTLTEKDPTVISEALSFAGTYFGVIRAELSEGASLSENDSKIFKLLSSQGAISLVNSRFTEEVLRMRRLGDETMQAKTGFLANLSHELRGPLGIILNGVELTMEGLCGEVSDPLKEMLRMIKDSGDHLLDLVNDVLDYAKVEAGKVKAVPVELPVKALLEDLCAVVRTQAHAKSHELLLKSVDSSLGILVDKRHARQMLINFLTNAIKYTPEGGKIEVWAEKFSDGKAKILIKDTGIGIPESEKGKVFGAFERVEDKYALTQSGTGLGMPLTKRLAEVNGGSVGFESKAGKGSTFWLSLPSTEFNDVYENIEDEASVKISGNNDGILLVDHNEETRRMLEQYLGKQGFRVFIATTGLEVLQLIRAESISLAVIENDLPGLPGEEIVSAIRSNPSSTQMPIILLSARAFVFDIERFLKLGVDRCLSKPVALAEVALTSRRLIDQTRNLEEKTLH